MDKLPNPSATIDRLQVLARYAVRYFDREQLRELMAALLAIPRADYS
ncbi:hypothetical protein [Belnapia moabensis]|nr:hypothetical protein [Belnapia moabensis]